jgi:hypothetical protein
MLPRGHAHHALGLLQQAEGDKRLGRAGHLRVAQISSKISGEPRGKRTIGVALGSCPVEWKKRIL